MLPQTAQPCRPAEPRRIRASRNRRGGGRHGPLTDPFAVFGYHVTGSTGTRRETAAASQDRDDLLGQRDTARACTASTPGNGDGDTSPASASVPAE